MFEDVLIDWNFWGDFDVDYIEREIKLEKYLSPGIATVVYGVRRSGKSFLAYGTLKKLIGSGVDPRKTLIVNFEDPRIKNAHLHELPKILEDYRKLTGESRPIIVLDEIQNIKGWESFVRYLVDNKKLNVIVTGSSSKLMSREYATVLTGRHINRHVFPLSFKEFLRFRGIEIKDRIDIIRKRAKLKKLFEEFAEWGGFPEVTLIKSYAKKRELLSAYLEDILTKDVASRFRIDNTEALERLANYLISNISSKFNIRKAARSLEMPHSTLHRYFTYISASDLFLSIKRLSYKVKEIERSFRKVYLVDVGFHTKLSTRFSRNFGKVLENIVFLQLARYYRLNRELFYYSTKSGKEVDFVIVRNGKVEKLVEVSVEGDEEHEKKLIKAGEELKCDKLLIITWDLEEEVKRNGKEISYVPAWKWFLTMKNI